MSEAAANLNERLQPWQDDVRVSHDALVAAPVPPKALATSETPSAIVKLAFIFTFSFRSDLRTVRPADGH